MTDAERRPALDAERQAALDAIAAEIRVCTRCRLHEGRNQAVPGEGHPATEVVFVGEGPGFNEDKQGRPFVGRAGDLLEKLLGSIYWKRDEVFIANVVKCRPPDNRDPEPDEIEACAPYLTRQLEVLDPALVVTLGRFSMARFNPGARIGQVHGTFKPADPESGAPDALAFFMYHPAAALRASAVEAESYADIQGVPKALLEARSRRSASMSIAGPASVPDLKPADDAGGLPSSEPEAAATISANEPAISPASGLSSAGSAVDAAVPGRPPGEQTDPTDQLPLF